MIELAHDKVRLPCSTVTEGQFEPQKRSVAQGLASPRVYPVYNADQIDDKDEKSYFHSEFKTQKKSVKEGCQDRRQSLDHLPGVIQVGWAPGSLQPE